MQGHSLLHINRSLKLITIFWQDEISRINAAIKKSREHAVKGKFLGSAFIRCNLQMGAHVLAQCLSYHEVCLLSLPFCHSLTFFQLATVDVQQVDGSQSKRYHMEQFGRWSSGNEITLRPFVGRHDWSHHHLGIPRRIYRHPQ